MKDDEQHNRYAMYPTYDELIDELALGFGLITNTEQGISRARSWAHKQGIYARLPHPKNHGLRERLVHLMAGRDDELARKLTSYLNGIETVLAELRSEPLFSRTTYPVGMKHFLSEWVLPQFAWLLREGQSRYGPTTPLFHFPDLLQDISEGNLDLAAHARKRVRAQLREVAKVRKPTEFSRTLSKLDTRSVKKLKTVHDELKALEIEIEASAEDLACVRAAYVAGTAFIRFFSRWSEFEDVDAAVRAFQRCYTLIERWKRGVPPASERQFVDNQFLVFDAMMQVDTPSALRKYPYDRAMKMFKQSYDKRVERLNERTCPPLLAAWSILDAEVVSVQRFEHALADFGASDRHAVFAPYMELAEARLALARGNGEVALQRFIGVVASGENQQLGAVGLEAAGCAIALEVALRDDWQPHVLDHHVTYFAQVQSQANSIRLDEFPTPFGSLPPLVDIQPAEDLVLDAIRWFNQYRFPMVAGVKPIYCNPLSGLEKDLEKFFSALNVGAEDETDRARSIASAVGIAFEAGSKRKVLRFLKDAVSPYAAIRDVFFWIDRHFPDFVAFVELNPYIGKYLRLPEAEQRQVLLALDEVAYKKETAHSPGT
jgi:hypothetical protein